jgi:hypothetical protein
MAEKGAEREKAIKRRKRGEETIKVVSIPMLPTLLPVGGRHTVCSAFTSAPYCAGKA